MGWLFIFMVFLICSKTDLFIFMISFYYSWFAYSYSWLLTYIHGFEKCPGSSIKIILPFRKRQLILVCGSRICIPVTSFSSFVDLHLVFRHDYLTCWDKGCALGCSRLSSVAVLIQNLIARGNLLS